ncbi:MAG: hypothetical protein ACKO0W_00105, partial [Planctomycetota bacterium]
QVLTLTVVVGVFVLGLLSDWMVARNLAASADLLAQAAEDPALALSALERPKWAALTAIRAALPNFQLFWLSDALTQKRPIPLDYIAYAVPYALCLVTALLSLATMLFQRREVG